MGRPPKHPDEARTERCAHIRLTVAERLDIEAKAAAMGVSVADYARHRLCGYRLPTRRGADLSRLLVEINRVGNNVNQIARAANATGRASPMTDAAMQELRAVMGQIVARLDEDEA